MKKPRPDGPTPLLRVSPLAALTPQRRARLLRRSAVPDRKIRDRASAIRRMAEAEGDSALRRAGTRYRGGRPNPRFSVRETANLMDGKG